MNKTSSQNRMKFAYPTEKFGMARRALMLPHPNGEAESIARAFELCSRCLRDLEEEDLDESAQSWIAKLEELMETREIKDPSGRGLWTIRAEQLSEDQKYELSNVIDELAHWFKSRYWGNN